MRNVFFLFFIIPFFGISQTLYNPQQLYDNSGGLFDEDSVRSIYLDFYNSNYHNYLVNAWFYNPDERIPAELSLNGIRLDSVGVRYKGNSTFCLPNDASNIKVPYNIDFNYYNSDQNLYGYKKLKLANAWVDPTFAKQIVSSNIYRKYLPVGESNLVKLFAQGNYVGLYVNDESINKQFLKKHYDEKSGPLFKFDNIERFCDTANAPSSMPPNLYYLGDDTSLYYNSYDMKSENGWSELVNLIRVINTNFDNIDSVLNVDRTLWAFAVNQVVSNLDCYNTYYMHNYYLYQTKDGLFQMIPWDLDNSFSGALLGLDYFNPSNVYEYDPYYTGGPYSGPFGEPQAWEARPLLEKLLNNIHYRKIYTAHIRTVIEESLNAEAIASNLNNLQSVGYDAANQDYNKLFSIDEYFSNGTDALWADFGWGIGGVLSTINERKQFLLNHPEISMMPPEINNLIVSNNLVTVEAFDVTSIELMATISEYNSKFQSFDMFDDGTNGDEIANDGVYSVNLPFQANGVEIKFYIRAQNDDAISLLPERAEYEFYIYSTSTGIANIDLSANRKLIGIKDVLGRNIKETKGLPLFYIYDDGTVEKKIILE